VLVAEMMVIGIGIARSAVQAENAFDFPFVELAIANAYWLATSSMVARCPWVPASFASHVSKGASSASASATFAPS
jgi:hypothetical protein